MAEFLKQRKLSINLCLSRNLMSKILKYVKRKRKAKLQISFLLFLFLLRLLFLFFYVVSKAWQQYLDYYKKWINIYVRHICDFAIDFSITHIWLPTSAGIPPISQKNDRISTHQSPLLPHLPSPQTQFLHLFHKILTPSYCYLKWDIKVSKLKKVIKTSQISHF